MVEDERELSGKLLEATASDDGKGGEVIKIGDPNVHECAQSHLQRLQKRACLYELQILDHFVYLREGSSNFKISKLVPANIEASSVPVQTHFPETWAFRKSCDDSQNLCGRGTPFCIQVGRRKIKV